MQSNKMKPQKTQIKNANLMALDAKGIPYQLFNNGMQANIQTLKGIIVVYVTNNKYRMANGSGKVKTFTSPVALLDILNEMGFPAEAQQNNCPNCNGALSVIDVINYIANEGLKFGHICKKCGSALQVSAKINLNVTIKKGN